jgi:transcription termination factor Rho
MSNYKLDELLAMSGDEIRSVAQAMGLNAKASDSLQEIAYMIIDEQAVEGSKKTEPKPKKTRQSAKAADATKKPAAKAKGDADKAKDDADTAALAAEEPAKKRPARRRKTDEPKPEAPAAEASEPAPQQPDAAPQPAAEHAAKPRKRTRKAETEPAPTPAADEKPAAPAETAPAAPAQPVASEPQASATEPEQDFIIIQDLPPIEPDDAPVDMLAAKSSADEMAADGSAQQKKDALAQQGRGSRAQEQMRASAQSYDFGDSIVACGVLDTTSEGQAFLRSADYNYLPSPDDIYVSSQQIKNYGLKMGDVVECSVRMPRENEKFFPLAKVLRINGLTPDQVRDRLSFEHLTPLFPNEKFRLCKGDGNDTLSARIVDLFAPIGKGQRALLVAQPKTGKTMLMKAIANAIADNHPEAYLMMLLIDERPEEVTDMARTVNAEVIASTFDEPASNHVKIAGIVLEKAKRMVECGHDVVIFLDSITRLARAYNTVAPASGKILTGGVDANALQKPKRFFGAARNIEGGGSLTIIATALIDTGSKMDEVIFEEFKGTGNMELQLDRNLSNKRIFPAVNCVASSTRRDDLLHNKMTLDRMWVLRNHIAEMTSMEAMNVIRNLMEKTKNNEEFLLGMNS